MNLQLIMPPEAILLFQINKLSSILKFARLPYARLPCLVNQCPSSLQSPVKNVQYILIIPESPLLGSIKQGPLFRKRAIVKQVWKNDLKNRLIYFLPAVLKFHILTTDILHPIRYL